MIPEWLTRGGEGRVSRVQSPLDHLLNSTSGWSVLGRHCRKLLCQLQCLDVLFRRASWCSRDETHKAGDTASPTRDTSLLPGSPRFPLSTPSRVMILPFIIFQGTGLSNSYFDSSFLLFSLMSSYLDICAGLIRGVQALLLHVCHCWRYVASVQPLRQGCGDAFPDSPLPCLHWVLPESLCALHFITCSLSFYCLFMLIFLPESDTGFITHLCESLAWRSDIVKRKDLEGKTWEILSLFWFCDKVCKWLGQSQAPSGKRGGWARWSLKASKMHFTMRLYDRMLFTCSPISVIVCLKQKR